MISTRLNNETYTAANGQPTPDYIYVGRSLPGKDKRMAGTGYLVDADLWQGEEGTYPVFTKRYLMAMPACRASIKFLFLTYLDLDDEVKALLRTVPGVVIIAQSNHQNRLGEQRALVHELWCEELRTPVVFFEQYRMGEGDKENFQLYAAADMGALMFDGLTDGIMLFNQSLRVSARCRSKCRTPQPLPYCRLPACALPRRSISAVLAAAARSTTCRAPLHASRLPQRISRALK